MRSMTEHRHGTNRFTSPCPISNAPTGSESSRGHAESRDFTELLIDCEEDRTLRAVLVGMLREADR